MKKYFLSIAFILFIYNADLFAQTQGEMNETAGKNFEKADAELNKVYKQLIKKLTGKEKQMLVTAQKNWIKFRDSDCDFTAEQFVGGSIKPLIFAGCLEEHTKQRIKELKAAIKSRDN